MRLVKRIVSTTMTSSIILIILVFGTVILSRFMLNLKELSNQTITVLAAWNALDRITNDVLYYRLDSVSRLEQIEDSWLKSRANLDRSFNTLKKNSLLKLLPREISGDIEKAWYIWLFSKGKLENGQKTFHNILHGEKADQVLFQLDKITFYDKLQDLIYQSADFEERQVYQTFLAQMYVLDITSESFSASLERIHEQIPGKIDSYIVILLFAVVVSFVLVILVSLSSSRQIIQPINRLASEVHRMSETDYPVEIVEEADFPAADDDDELHIIHNAFNRMAGRIHALYEDSLRKEREKREAQFRALQYQINPHFLYNTLGSLRMSAAVHGDMQMAESIQALSRLLRNTISKSRYLIRLDEELEIMQDYIALIQFRYKNRLNYRVDVGAQALDCFVPALILQPLLENAVLHGLSSRLNTENASAELLVSGKLDEDHLVLSVSDNGKGIAKEQLNNLFEEDRPESSSGSFRIGLKNIHDRIVLLFGESCEMNIKSKMNEYTSIMIRIPAVTEEADAAAFGR